MKKLIALALVCCGVNLLTNAQVLTSYEGIELNRSAWPYIIFKENGAVVGRIQGVNGNFAVTSTSGGVNHLTVNSTSGFVGIGTAPSSLSRLDVAGLIAANGQAFVTVDANSILIGDVAGSDGYRDKLHFYTRDVNRATIDQNGNVGIGTSTPQAKVSLRTSTATQGLIISNCDAIGQQSHFGMTTADQSRLGDAAESYFNIYNDGKWNFNSSHTSGTTLPLAFSTNGQSRLFIKADGNIGIGTTAPDEKLTVNGTIHSTRVKVDVTVPAPDYVFEKDYNLPSLQEIKKYIDENKHLPEVPSAKEFEKNGMDVVEMNMLLLKKVEELTLHLIEQDKMIEQLKKENTDDSLVKKVEELMMYVKQAESKIDELSSEVSSLKRRNNINRR